ncbi:MAG: hypothetical protein PSV18_06330 [Methylobacter sp.]|uniref:Uncharacterized protein n=1 Tax=Candidatus Methylobacter titanis TaxID=3053457 RepID=A0AA43Q354_9GAMM|nr:hypothetical protein [Candidatus Methylobacter titanis]MDI1292345.1 hypothetical protein [Candidatus Methylobacter titanis]
MLNGINLTLLIGPAVPVPAPQAVMDALHSIQVNSGGGRSGFQLSFSVSKKSLLLTTLLPVGYFDPMLTRVIIMATINGLPNVLMDGIVTRQEMSPSSEPGQSKLTITGEDLSVLMDVVELKRPFPGMDDTLQMLTILTPYAAFGIVPLVMPSLFLDFMSPTEGWESQDSTDLAHIQKLTTRNGYVFYLEPGPLPGQSLAYFGPNIRLPVPQPALNVNMDVHTNVESLSFSLNGLAKEVMIVTIMDPITHKIPIPIPIPNISIFQPPLGARPTPPAKIRFADNVANKRVATVLKETVGLLMKGSANAITGNGSLDVLRYGRVLRSRMLVGVRGAGLAYDGLYYVDTVTHNIKHGEYKQSFTLSRDGLIANTPRVLP